MHFSDTNQWKAPTGLSIQRISTCKHKFTKIKNPQMCRDQIFWLNSFGSSIGYQVIFFFTRRPSASRKKNTGESTCKQEVASSATTETAETTVQDMKVRSDMEPKSETEPKWLSQNGSQVPKKSPWVVLDVDRNQLSS